MTPLVHFGSPPGTQYTENPSTDDVDRVAILTTGATNRPIL